jgi:hypothetical protein
LRTKLDVKTSGFFLLVCEATVNKAPARKELNLFSTNLTKISFLSYIAHFSKRTRLSFLYKAIEMETTTLTTQQPYVYASETGRKSIISRFFNWCNNQQENRLLWLGIVLTAHGCIFTPITVMIVLFAGSNLTLFVLGLVSMGIALVTNLAALPTKITIPAFVFSILMDVVLVIIGLVHGVDVSSTYI